MGKITVHLFLFFFPFWLFSLPKVEVGVDVFFNKKHDQLLVGKRVGLITNHTGVDKEMRSTISRFQEAKTVVLMALFSPEHGMKGIHYAGEKVENKGGEKLQIFSLYGKTRRPTKEMLETIDVLVFDVQCIGSRSYTYTTTLFYAMEEAAKHKIPLIVLDRPNPINGLIVDGPLLEEKWRSYIGYVNVPYCHGMTIGELAHYFNEEYKVGCALTVIPMEGWKRHMSYRDTNLHWVPPSPHIPESDTPFFYPTTGILGELKIVNIGVGYTLPFKVIGAPWINGEHFAQKLNEQNLPGVLFSPFHYRPFYGMYKGEECSGVMIRITDLEKYRPIAVQFLLLGMLKSLYPKEFLQKMEVSELGKNLFCKALGTDAVYHMLKNEKYVTWKLLEFHKKERELFLTKRKKYLLPQYE